MRFNRPQYFVVVGILLFLFLSPCKISLRQPIMVEKQIAPRERRKREIMATSDQQNWIFDHPDHPTRTDISLPSHLSCIKLSLSFSSKSCWTALCFPQLICQVSKLFRVTKVLRVLRVLRVSNVLQVLRVSSLEKVLRY